MSNGDCTPEREKVMATLYPRVNPDEIENEGERIIAKALMEQFPANIEVYHRFHWFSETRSGSVVEHETDFIIIDPNFGMLVVEVKGGDIHFDGESGTWIQSNRVMKSDPVSQAQSAMHRFKDEILSSFYFRTNGQVLNYGYAVAFPSYAFSGSMPPSMRREFVWDAKNTSNLYDAYKKCCDIWRRDATPLSGRHLDAIRDCLRPNFNLVESVVKRVEAQERVLLRLTNDQIAMLRFISNVRRACVRGDAGSGKTMLAVEKARELARSGVDTLFLCYNAMLADWVRQSVPEHERVHLSVHTFHELAYQVCAAGHEPLPSYSDSDVHWDIDVPLAMERCVASVGGFEAIIVDEGQDFRDLWWDVLEKLLRNPNDGEPWLYVFFDPHQCLKHQQPSLPTGMSAPFLLPHNCRNTRRIAQRCGRIIGKVITSPDSAPEGIDPVDVRQTSFRGAVDEIRKAVVRYQQGVNGLRSGQVVILAPSEVLVHIPKTLGVWSVSDNPKDWQQGRAVLKTTVGKFKGLEADVVVAIKGSGDSTAEEYVACSRAKHELVVINL